MCSVARGKTWAGRRLTAASSAWNAASYASAISAGRLVLEAGRDEHPVLAPVEALVAEVADVGDVLDVEDLDAVVEEDAPDQVGEHERPQVADVGEAVDGRAAGVHPDAAAVGGAKRLDGPGEGVPEAEGHAEIVPPRASRAVRRAGNEASRHSHRRGNDAIAARPLPIDNDAASANC